jgi:hypothetical protein
MQDQNNPENKGMALYILTRGLLALVVVVLALWAMAFFIGKLNSPDSAPVEMEASAAAGSSKSSALPLMAESSHAPTPPADAPLHTAAPAPDQLIEHAPAQPAVQPTQPPVEFPAAVTATPPVSQAAPPTSEPHPAAPAPAPHAPASVEPSQSHTAPPGETAQGVPAHGTGTARPIGVAFVDAVIKPMDHELNERFWGWRPNDIINITDNVNNFQLGVLEVTRRTAVQLVEGISRTGSTDAIDRNLENAMNWLMIKATSYWFPTPESKYKESLRELNRYKTKLVNGTAFFYIRTDNLIPLLAVYKDLLGSCDENLVKESERDGSTVSYFTADDYFYYAKGVVSAMATILEAIHTDFAKTLENRRAGELLHHAVESCRRASEVQPWLVTDADLDGILANHRANIAAPISHASFYLGQAIKALST